MCVCLCACEFMSISRAVANQNGTQVMVLKKLLTYICDILINVMPLLYLEHRGITSIIGQSQYNQCAVSKDKTGNNVYNPPVKMATCVCKRK